ncbi:MAG: 4Fe-4S binding protein, partial [Bdellovibrionales bacterium]|nr:4Fe-4S binding protein [Oligoflexia bacterium]
NSVFSEAPKILKDYCGSCTRCLSACPTGALENHDLDSRKCISYLTLEKRGEWEQEYPLKGFLAGCDLCQDVCPYNSKAVRYTEAEAIQPHLICDLETLSEETEVEYRERVKGTALSRVKYADFRRNLKSVISSQMK